MTVLNDQLTYISLNSRGEFLSIDSKPYARKGIAHSVSMTEADATVLHDAVTSMGESIWLSIRPLEGLPGRSLSIILGANRYPDPLGHCIPCSDRIRVRIVEALATHQEQ